MEDFKPNVNPIEFHDRIWRVGPTKPKEYMTTPIPHPHAAKMAEYAQDAAIDGEAWRNWEFRFREEEQWEGLIMKQAWLPECEYRRKPEPIKMIKVTLQNGKVVEFPEPLRVAPANGTPCFVVSTMELGKYGHVRPQTWYDFLCDNKWLESGLCHLTHEAAEKHAAALLAINRGE